MGKVFAVRQNGYDRAEIENAVEGFFNDIPALCELCEGKKVLLKPNLLTKASPQKAVTTHPEIVRAVITALLKRGVRAGDITVADSCGGAAGDIVMNGIYKASGMEQVCRETGAVLYTHPKGVAVKCPDGRLVHEFTVLDICRQTDIIINLPKLKTHVMAGLSAATKNLYGTIPGLTKAELHMQFPTKEGFGDMLIDLNLVHKNVVTVVDGITAMQGDGPSGGTPYNANILLAGDDRFLIDLALCRLIDIAPEKVPYLQKAFERGLCPADYSPDIMACGAELIKPLENFEKPKSFLGFDFSGGYPKALRWAAPIVNRTLSPKPHINRKICIGCGKCAEICPQKIIEVKNKKAAIVRPKNCIHCFCCHEMCPAKAIRIKKFKIFDFKL